MNLPNKLTVARIIATPIFMAAMLLDLPHGLHYLVALILFIAASLTDMLDGKIARKNNLITDFGKFLDPLADKMLTTAALLGFIYRGIGYGVTWIVFIVLFREFLISSLRLVVVSSKSGKVIAANIWGKLKTVSQMVAVIFALFAYYLISLNVLPSVWNTAILPIAVSVLLWISAIFAVISGVIYMAQNKEFVDPSK